jgi:hypothetical protein
MSRNALVEAERLVDELTPAEQVRLLEYLAPRIASAVAAPSMETERRVEDAAQEGKRAEGWEEFFRAGDAIAAEDRPGLPTLTETLLSMRR